MYLKSPGAEASGKIPLYVDTIYYQVLKITKMDTWYNFFYFAVFYSNISLIFMTFISTATKACIREFVQYIELFKPQTIV